MEREVGEQKEGERRKRRARMNGIEEVMTMFALFSNRRVLIKAGREREREMKKMQSPNGKLNTKIATLPTLHYNAINRGVGFENYVTPILIFKSNFLQNFGRYISTDYDIYDHQFMDTKILQIGPII